MIFADPEHNIKQFDLKEGSSVADLGSGSGFYSFEAARAVGPSGKVYSIDVQKDLLHKITAEAKHKGLGNIETIWGNVEKTGGTKLGDSSMDEAILSNILFQIEDKKSFAEEVYRIVKMGGKILVIDWTDSFRNMGPHKDAIVSKDTARKLFEGHGFKFDKDIFSGEHHYGIIFRKI